MRMKEMKEFNVVVHIYAVFFNMRMIWCVLIPTGAAIEL